MARLLSVNVGLPRNIEWQGKTVHTAVWKKQVQGRRMVRRLNVDGDGQGDLAGHGGEHRAVFVYQIESYRYWQVQLRRNDFSYGQFGENFTVDGLADDEVCIGDRYRIGTALFEVTSATAPISLAGSHLGETRHVCAFFNNDEEEYRVLPPFIKDGLESGDKAVHVLNPEQRPDHLLRLTAAGIDPEVAQQSGQLEL